MNDILFDGIHKVANEEAVVRMRYYIEEAQKGMRLFETDKKGAMSVAKEIRQQLQREYKNNDLLRIRKAYADHDLFQSNYSPAVHESIASITGPLSYKNLYSFLYDVKDYMSYNIPSKYEESFD
ncbi:hypothetical protein [Sporosarcina sp. FSL K6-3508]|uniref:hypothetical protein n=1 Tax=Sporosarcina sp. FSL K6-3508 TaxID=2921557 RepID=UPI00315B2DA9